MKQQPRGGDMRRFESSAANVALPGVFIVARVDGRSFTRLTKEQHNFEAPFDVRFRDYMLEAATALMLCGPAVVYGYVQSDEISLLLRRDDGAFGRKLSKLNSVFAGVASAAFSLALGDMAVFDCRIAQLPRKQDVVNYFRWRQADATRNALGAHCYWMLRKRGLSAGQVTQKLQRLSAAERHDLLMSGGINFNNLPSWQKRGVGLRYQQRVHTAIDPRNGELAQVSRRKLTTEFELPARQQYDAYMTQVISDADPANTPRCPAPVATTTC